MFATLLVFDDLDLGTQRRRVSDVDQVQAAVRALDGSIRTMVTIGSSESHLTIAGSRGGLVVSATLGDNGSYTLTDGRKDDGSRVLVVAGGQPAEYPANVIVPLDMALAAAAQFTRDGTLAQHLSWVPD